MWYTLSGLLEEILDELLSFMSLHPRNTPKNHMPNFSAKTIVNPTLFSFLAPCTDLKNFLSLLLQEFKKMKIRRRYRYMICRIEQDTVAVDRLGERDAGTTELKAELPNSDCRYVIYDYEYTTPDGRKPSKLFFLCW